MSDKYSPIDMPENFPGNVLPFDLYVSLEGKFIKYRKKLDVLSKDLILKLKRQSVSQLYISDSDMNDYVNFLKVVLESSTQSNNLSQVDKAQIVVSSSSSCLKQAFKNPNSKIVYEEAKITTQAMIDLIKEDLDFVKSLMYRRVDDSLIVEHCKNVAALSIMTGISLNLSLERIENLALAGIFHDIAIAGLDEQARDLFERDATSLSDVERDSYLKHVSRAKKILSGKPYINDEVIKLVGQHEENLIINHSLSIDSQVLSVSNKFDKWMTVNLMSLEKAINELHVTCTGFYDDSVISSFIAALNVYYGESAA